jgi:hypothetical protein
MITESFLQIVCGTAEILIEGFGCTLMIELIDFAQPSVLIPVIL